MTCIGMIARGAFIAPARPRRSRPILVGIQNALAFKPGVRLIRGMSDPMASLGSNPFTLLSLIGGPAVLTNAASLLVLSTSNRFARAIDRARALSAHLHGAHAATDPQSPLRMHQLRRAERRSLMLLHALRMYYLALGSFATASLVSLLGSGAATTSHELLLRACIVGSLGAGTIGVGSLVLGCVQLVRETRLAVFSITEEAELLRERHADFSDAVP